MTRTPADETRLSAALARAFARSLTPEQSATLRALISEGAEVSPTALRLLPALADLAPEGRVPPEIGALLAPLLAPAPETDLRVLRLEQAPFAAITLGAQSAAEMAADLPDRLVSENLKVGLFKTVQALKSGDIPRADAVFTVMSEHFDIPALEACGSDHAPELICLLFMKAIYADEDISDQATERLFAVLASLPKDASLIRGILYNVALDMFLRQHRVAEAEQAAHRALFHYAAAREQGVTFYVHLYLTVIGLWRGDIPMADKHLTEARHALSAFHGATKNDALLLRSFDMIVAYEQGDAAPFVKHLMGDGDTIPFGELWPSVADPIISTGRRALANHVTPAAALSWVRRWRVRQQRSRRFDRLISTQEALALQDLGRWQEADEILGGITRVETAETQIARMASGLDRNPKSAALGRQLSEYLAAPTLSVRQRLTLRLLACENALGRAVDREAARHLSAAINDLDPEQFPSLWAEHRRRVADILSKRDLRAELRRFPRLQRQIRALAQVEATQKPDALTRQEFRVLQLLAEAQSNKAIGQRLGISLPTVKFHVANLCRKTQTTNRRAVVRAAIDTGWISEV